MSEVKYKAVKEYAFCEGCCNYSSEDCNPFIDQMKDLGLPSCGTEKIIYKIDTSTVTIEQAREKFESHYCRPAIDRNPARPNRYHDIHMQNEWESYLQALEDFNILEEGE